MSTTKSRTSELTRIWRWATASVLLGAAACSTSAAQPKSATTPVFGGQGGSATVASAASGAGEMPLPAETPKAAKAAGPCDAPSRPTDLTLLDDFEDGDNHLFKGFERDGYWFSKGDATEGAHVFPEPGKFAPERLPPSESTANNLFAGHFKASGQRDWGAVWGTTLQWESQGIRCPLNASTFAGIRFRARGPATIRVNVGMLETQAADTGGTCTSGCYDYHGKVVFLTDRWVDTFVPWDRLQQGGWGAQARFDAARVINLQFYVAAKDMPADFWIDDIQFVTPREAEAILAADRRTGPVAVAK